MESDEDTTQAASSSDADMGSTGETGSLRAERHVDYVLVLAAAIGGLVGSVAGPGIRAGIKALVRKRRKKE